MVFNYASRYRLRNKFTNNIISQSDAWPHQNGLFVYGGSNVSDDQIWYFLSVSSNSFRITNFLWRGWSIAANSVDGAFVTNGPDQLDQHWMANVIQEGNDTYLYITNAQNTLALRDQNAPNTSGNLSAVSVAEADARAQWCLVAV